MAVAGRRGGRALVIAGGDAPTPAELEGEPRWEWVVAADSGLDHAEALGLRVDAVVGDLDSVTAGALQRARDAGVVIDQHPTDKNATDLELAMDAALEHGASSLFVLGVGGGRPDHALANLFLLADQRYAEAEVDARTADARIMVVRSRPRVIRGEAGAVVTLLPVHGPARRVRTEGLRWPLRDEDLGAASTRGVSNEITHSPGWVVAGDGVLLAILPR